MVQKPASCTEIPTSCGKNATEKEQTKCLTLNIGPGDDLMYVKCTERIIYEM